MVRVVRDRQAHFVQVGGPAQRGAQLGALGAFGHHGVEQRERGVMHAAGLVRVHVIALHELAHGFVALVVLDVAAQQVVQHAQPQRAVARVHDLDAQLVEQRAHDGQPAGQHVGALDLDAGQFRRHDAPGADDAILQLGQAGARDAAVGHAAFGQDGEQRLAVPDEP